MTEKYDVIIVGAGPAGVSSAITTAKAGLSTALIERGDFAGSKNMFGGIVYSKPTAQIVPEFWKTAPIERRVIEYQYWLLSQESHVSISHRNQKFNKDFNSFTALRARFDKWFAQQAETNGAMLLTKTTVSGVLKDSEGRVNGVTTDRGDLSADVVIACDGVNSLVSKGAGLHDEWKPEDIALAVKETYALPKEKIEDRFHLRGDEGATVMIYGGRNEEYAGFIYTNKDTISFGMGAIMSDLAANKTRPQDILEWLKSHPSIKPLIDGAALREYTAHLIPEGGYDKIPRIFSDGIMVAGDAAMLVNALNWEGTNFAMISGMYSGQAAVQAKRANNYTANQLSNYRRYLEECFVLKDLKKFRRVPQFIASKRQFLTLYPELMNDIFYKFFEVDGRPKQEHLKEIKDEIYTRRGRMGLLKDIYELYRIAT
ncbi:MAG: FAD-dependent oxidoreductase [Nitrososphaerota archaeon]|nr:FAD-dependent oxidoreductase [Nitrososphaerota archaeon]MDG6923952.1 FAD-dependent oxidoreductase [Nitrososphaerota archaeon]